MDRGDYFVMAIGAFHRIHIGEGSFCHFVFLFLFFLCQFGIEKFAAIAAFFCFREDFFGAVGAFLVFRHGGLLLLCWLEWCSGWMVAGLCCGQPGRGDGRRAVSTQCVTARFDVGGRLRSFLANRPYAG